jgi:CPA1 family monovalent cation:H+ antiporter
MGALELVILLLAASVALQVVAQRLAIPQPALLVLGGVALAFVPGLPRVSLDPAVVFLVFVPPLLYYASASAPLREFTAHAKSILLLSVFLVLVTMTAVAAAAHLVAPKLSWATAFVLGAIVAAPDPIAAIAVLRPLGAPAALTAVLEGEGMFNDATALVAYRIALGAAVSGAFSVEHAAVEFLWTGALGTALGLLTGVGVIAIRRQMQGFLLVDNSISLLTPFIAYVPADALGGSGILAVIAAGLYVGHALPRALSPAARIQSGATWAMVTFILENLAFILIGLELTNIRTRPTSLSTFILCGVVVSLVVIGVRIVCVLSGAWLGRVFAKSRSAVAGWKQAMVLSWTGVRGAESVVIALALPHVTAAGTLYPGRNLTIFVTFAVVFATLVLQGLTIRGLLGILGLDGDQQHTREEAHARHVLASTGLQRLDELARTTDAPPDMLQELRQGQRRALTYRRLRAEMIAAEHRAAVELRDRGVIGAGVLRRIERDLDLEVMGLGDTPQDGFPRTGNAKTP